jgi:hypothetical protein
MLSLLLSVLLKKVLPFFVAASASLVVVGFWGGMNSISPYRYLRSKVVRAHTQGCHADVKSDLPSKHAAQPVQMSSSKGDFQKIKNYIKSQGGAGDNDNYFKVITDKKGQNHLFYYFPNTTPERIDVYGTLKNSNDMAEQFSYQITVNGIRTMHDNSANEQINAARRGYVEILRLSNLYDGI